MLFKKNLSDIVTITYFNINFEQFFVHYVIITRSSKLLVIARAHNDLDTSISAICLMIFDVFILTLGSFRHEDNFGLQKFVFTESRTKK